METARKPNGSKEEAQKKTVTYRVNGDLGNRPRMYYGGGQFLY